MNPFSVGFVLVGILVTLVTTVTGCQSLDRQGASQISSNTHERSSVKGLSVDEAQYRSQLLSSLKYALLFKIASDGPDFTGEEQLDFKLTKPQPLTLDFKEGHILNLQVNGINVSNVNYNQEFLTLPSELLKTGENSVKIGFSHAYSDSGSGLYRFKDPEDGRTYLYSDFEPFSANKLFPCFDQPDLKANFKLKVQAPAEWTVISAASVASTEKLGEGQILWIFHDSAPISTYLISLHAGPYKMWSSFAGKIPIRLFARQSVAKYVNSHDWLKITEQGLKFYQNYFAYPYPFKKFDEIIVPDFNEGAMENVAAITFSERFVKKGKMTQEDREDMASVVLHEMAHMWFGDLVTMKWWNGLWLNESFATYSSAFSQNQATEFKRGWTSFFLSEKQWAYYQDQLVTTHPIEGTVANTDEAFANFDGITYGKGASVLKQLSFYIGESAYRAGVGHYFKNLAYKNARLEDFIKSLQGFTPLDLTHWKSEWLETSGVNTIETKFNCKDGKIALFELHQRSQEGKEILRTHRTQIGLYSRDMYGHIKIQKSIPVTYSGSITQIPSALGESCPVLVYPNYGDFDYVKVELDPITLVSAKAQLSKILDPMNRVLFWSALWDMTREGNFNPALYAGLIFDHLENESDYKIVDFVLKTIINKRNYLPSLVRFMQGRTPDEKILELGFRLKLEQFIERALAKAVPGSDIQSRYFDTFVSLAQSVGDQEKLKAYLNKTVQVPGLEIDQDRRWNILIKLSSLGNSETDGLLALEKTKDPSSEGVKSAIGAEAAKPLAQVKGEWMNRYLVPGEMAFAQLRSSMKNLFPFGQENLRAQNADFFYSHLENIVATRDPGFQDLFASELVPYDCQELSVKDLRNYLDKSPKLTPIVVKKLRMTLQEDERCVKVKNLVDFTSFR